jgi:hypothetical protein
MAFNPIYIQTLGFKIVIDYFAGIWLEELQTSEPNELKWTYYEKIINNNPDDYFLPRKSFFY